MGLRDENKVKLIRFVQEQGSLMDRVAQSLSMDFARDPQNKEKQASASKAVSVADNCKEMANVIIDQIHANWPQENGYIVSLESALRQALNVMEKAMEVRVVDQWPALKPLLPEAIAAAKRVLNIETKK